MEDTEEVEVEAKADLNEETGTDQKAEVVLKVEVGAKVGIVRRVFQKKRKPKINATIIRN